MYVKRVEIGLVLVCALSWAGAFAQVPGFWKLSVVAPGFSAADTCSLAFFDDGRPAVSYSGIDAGTVGLWYAEFDGAAWQRALVAEASVQSNAVAIFAGRPAVAYHAGSWAIKSLYFAQPANGTWTTTAINEPNDAFTYRVACHLAAQPDTGLPAIAEGVYCELSWANGALYWRFDGTAWHHEVAFAIGGRAPAFQSCSLSYAPEGTARMVFAGSNTIMGNTGYILAQSERSSGGTWSDPKYVRGSVSRFDSLGSGVLPDGELAISYREGGEVYYYPPRTLIASAGAVNDLAVLRSGAPAIALYPGGLQFAWRAAETWRTMDVDPAAQPSGAALRMVLRPDTGQPGIAYYDNAAGQVKFALAFFRGDLNCDGLINFDDINPFVLALTDPAGYAQAFPDCNIVDADVNEDGVANFEDINPFVALLAG